MEISDNVAALCVLLLVALVAIKMLTRKGKGGLTKRWGRRAKDALDQPLFWWDSLDPFSIRDLLNGGLLSVGRSGSGKTSSARLLGQSVVNHPQSGGLILAAQPQDVGMWKEIFRKTGRLRDLIIFDAEGPYRFNFLDYVGRGPVRNTVQCMEMIGETLGRGEGKDGDNDNRFYKAFEGRILYNTVAPLKAAGEPIEAGRMLKFIMDAPTAPQELNSDQWKALYHYRVMERADSRPKGKLEAHDFQLCKEFWGREYVFLDGKTRSNGLAGVMNLLSVFNQGIVKELIGGKTNCSPDDILNGRWLLSTFAPSVWGAVGQFISTGFKYCTQLGVLKRKAEERSPFVAIWCDEAHQVVNSFDSTYLAMCRSHKGCMVYLTQSVSSFYAALKGEAGRHQADALLANFSHVVVHPCDPMTAKWASAKLGRRKQILWSGSSSPVRNEVPIWDQMHGPQHTSCSFSEHVEAVLQDQKWMVGRTGGPANGFICDAIVVKSGEPFADGESFKRVAFRQR
jgi:hypothetical protein